VGVRIYYGWVIVAIAAVTFALVVGATLQSFGLFVLPVSHDFGLTRAEMNMGAILLNLGMAFASPFLGRLVDRFPARPIILISGVVFGGSLVVLGLSTSPLLSAVVMALPLGAALVGCGTLTSPALVSRWFTVHRSRALAISSIGVSMGPVVVTPVLGRMIEAMGWRESLIVLGIVSGVLIAAMAMLARNAPGPSDIEPGAAELRAQQLADGVVADAPLAIGKLLLLPQFWTLAVGCALVMAILTADIVSLIPLVQGNGLSIARAASLMSVYGVCAILGALVFAWVGDKFSPAVIFAIMAVTIGAANGGLMVFHDYGAVVVCSGLMGVVGGMTSPVFMALMAEYFGIASFGLVIGTASLAVTLLSAVAVRFGGEIFDRTGHYDLMLLSFLVAGVLSAALLIGTRLMVRPRAPTHPVPLGG
jgi:MFS family permease